MEVCSSQDVPIRSSGLMDLEVSRCRGWCDHAQEFLMHVKKISLTCLILTATLMMTFKGYACRSIINHKAIVFAFLVAPLLGAVSYIFSACPWFIVYNGIQPRRYNLVI
jgi:hypothetical protein